MQHPIRRLNVRNGPTKLATRAGAMSITSIRIGKIALHLTNDQIL